MSSEVRGVTNDWGEYSGYIGDLFGHCADYLSRLQRSLAGEIAPDRFYFMSKAGELKVWATHLVKSCEEIDEELTREQGLGGEG